MAVIISVVAKLSSSDWKYKRYLQCTIVKGKGKLTPFPSELPPPSEDPVGRDLAGGEPLVEGLGHPHERLRGAHGAQVLLIVVGECHQLITGNEM